jgi:hypothetical protein
MYESPGVVGELRVWLRLSPRDPRYELDGLSYDCLALSRFEAFAVGLLLRPRVYPLVRRSGLHKQFSSSATALLEREGSALVLVGPADAPEQLVGHGRALHRVWLALTRRGLYTHPLSQIIDCSATERELSARLGVDDGLRPLSVFRVGRSRRRPSRTGCADQVGHADPVRSRLIVTLCSSPLPTTWKP